ncbi:MAG: putative rane protein [Candidatus Kaiserbacteria bacterium]|nr:putative rane protein [Candidatus Kaiserbacteria bacterium]
MNEFSFCPSLADVAQLVEHVLGKDEVIGSIPIVGSMKNLARGRGYILSFTLAYIALFSAGFMYGGNYEFAIYTVVMVAATLLVALIARDTEIPNGFLWALSGMGILHMLGGGVHIHGERLYAYRIWDLYESGDPGLVVLKYDQFIHLLGYAVIAVAIHYVLRRTMPGLDAIGRAVLSILAAMAIGSINELAEFSAVLLLPRTGVGDYFNTMLDLSFNTLGAVAGVVLYESWVRLKKYSE